MGYAAAGERTPAPFKKPSAHIIILHLSCQAINQLELALLEYAFPSSLLSRRELEALNYLTARWIATVPNPVSL